MAELLPSWGDIREIVKEFGLRDGIFLLFFFLAHGWIYSQYQGRLADRQKEIDRLAADVREYRNMIVGLFDKHFGYTRPGGGKSKSAPTGGKS